jgi:hypothetical protein
MLNHLTFRNEFINLRLRITMLWLIERVSMIVVRAKIHTFCFYFICGHAGDVIRGVENFQSCCFFESYM